MQKMVHEMCRISELWWLLFAKMYTLRKVTIKIISYIVPRKLNIIQKYFDFFHATVTVAAAYCAINSFPFVLESYWYIVTVYCMGEQASSIPQKISCLTYYWTAYLPDRPSLMIPLSIWKGVYHTSCGSLIILTHY